MWKLLPRHMEIIEEIDKRVYPPHLLSVILSSTSDVFYSNCYILQFIAMVRSTRSDLESKIPSMCILDNNPKKPVVRMANLCVVSAHTVRGLFL